MEFLNIGGGELLVIALLALVLFGPEDIVKMMRTIGKYARQARDMWSQFSSGIQQELQTDEIQEALSDTQATMAEAQEALKSLTTSVGDIKSTVEKDVSQAQRSVKSQAAESAAALTQETKGAISTAQSAALEADSTASTDGDGGIPKESDADSLVEELTAGDGQEEEAPLALTSPEDTEEATPLVLAPHENGQDAPLALAPQEDAEEAPAGAVPYAATPPAAPGPSPESAPPPELTGSIETDQSIETDEEADVDEEVAPMPALDEEH